MVCCLIVNPSDVLAASKKSGCTNYYNVSWTPDDPTDAESSYSLKIAEVISKLSLKQIQDKTCHRIYRAVAYGKFNNESGTIETCLARGNSQHEKIFVVPFGQGRLAITNYKVLEYSKGFSYVEYELKTGRTHQIRVHSAHLNHPIVGDKLYGRKGEKFNLAGQLLHAYKLIFVHPVTKQKMEFCAEIPDYFEDFLKNHF